MNRLETLPDLVGSIEPGYVDHLILGNIVRDQDLSIDIVIVPDVTSSWIDCRIGTFEIAIDIRFYTTETEDQRILSCQTTQLDSSRGSFILVMLECV